MAFLKAQNVSIFRKVALSLWGSGGDPSVYGFLEIDVTDSDVEQNPMPHVLRALAETMKEHKEMRSILRFGRLFYRRDVSISVMVNIPEKGRNDLSFATLQRVDKMTLQEISEAVKQSSHLIRKRQDPHLGFVWRLIRLLPWSVIKHFLKIYALLTHDLNWNLKALRLPRAPFGSVIVTNVGSLGIKKALVPLVPLSRAPIMVALGEVTKEVRVVEDQMKIRSIIHLGVTYDHRFFDGSHAAAMIRDFEDHLRKSKST